jgi:galactan 5-O-arabinofuranosyltransferase
MLTNSGVAADPSSSGADRLRVTRPVSGLTALAWQLPVSAVVAVLASLTLQWCIARLPIPSGSNVATALLNLTSVVVLAVLLGLVAVPRWPGWCTPLSWIGLSVLGTFPLSFLLQGNRFYLFGLSGDQFFRTQYLTRLADSPALADGNYAGIPPFYPAGWFWVGGRFANLIGFPAWASYKPWAIVTMAVAPVLAFVLWSIVVRRPVALLLAALCALVGLRAAAYEPYSWVLIAVLVPVSVIVWQQRPISETGKPNFGWGAPVLAGLCLGACAAIYTLLALFFGATLFALAAAAALVDYRASRRDRNAESTVVTYVSWWRPVWAAASRLLVSYVIALPLSVLVWAPYLLADGPSEPNPAGRFLPKVGAVLPTPMMELSVAGLVCLLGAVWIVWSWHRSEIAQTLGLLVVGCYLWYLASILALSAGTTLLAFRAEPILLSCLVCAGALGAWEFLRWLGGKWQQHRTVIKRTAFSLTLLAMLALTQTVSESLEEAVTPGLFDQAYATYDDTGHRARPEADRSDGGAWNGELLATIGQLSRTQPQDTVMVTSEPQLLAFRPYRGFQTVVNAYANPLADYNQRRVLVESWSRSAGPEELLAALDRSPFAPPTVFVLTRRADGLHLPLSRDVFPHEPNSVSYDVVFPENLFAAPQFSQRDVGPYTVVARG